MRLCIWVKLSNGKRGTLELDSWQLMAWFNLDNLDILMFPKFLCFSKAKNLPQEFINIKKSFTAVKYYVAQSPLSPGAGTANRQKLENRKMQNDSIKILRVGHKTQKPRINLVGIH